ncbi:MAG: cohesin domain-containing protein [Candidatus Aenigmarchaeota archaeon]|nr:cohesin domain-containing protein [Candidatus Aenigmarchaeota archaeon]
MMGFQKKRAIAAASFIIFIIAFSPGASSQTLSLLPTGYNVSLYSSSTTAVNASITSVTNLYGYQYDILYDQSVLSHNNISEGPFLRSGTSTLCITPNIATPGIFRNIACTRTGSTSASGTGNLTRITFNLNLSIILPVTTQVRIVNSKLSDINSQAITHTIANGTINIKACLSGETKACGSNVGECRSGTQTCLASNDWNATCGGAYRGPSVELCNGRDDDCDTQYDENVTGSGNLSRSCSLFHYGICAAGNEVCNGAAYAGCPTPTTETCYDGIDQDCSGGANGGDSLCQGDIANSTGITPDGCIDIFDLSSVALDFGKTSGFANPNSDVDKNGIVDIFDLVYVGKDFGVKRPGATC